MIDIVATWPKTKPLDEYLDGLRVAYAHGLEVNFRVARRPRWEFGALRDRPARCYMVHDGAVRGYNEVRFVTFRGEAEVKRLDGGHWPAGWYVVRDPEWHPIDPLPMRGFQGWRWFEP